MSKKIMHCIIREECDIVYESGYNNIEEILMNLIDKKLINREVEIITIHDYNDNNTLDKKI